MEVPLWEDLPAYIRNSAVFNAQNMKTPLLIEVGDGVLASRHRAVQRREAREEGGRAAPVRRRGSWPAQEGESARLSPPNRRVVRALLERRAGARVNYERRFVSRSRARAEAAQSQEAGRIESAICDRRLTPDVCQRSAG